MDWSEILTESEAIFMRHILDRLVDVHWARPLVREIENRDGIASGNKPHLFEARIAYELHRQGLAGVEYEFAARVSNSTVDFRLGTEPDYLIEAVSIGLSDAKKRARFHDGPFHGMVLSSPKDRQSQEERKQSEEEESFRVVQNILGKAYDRRSRSPIKFPAPQGAAYHIVVVDMRGHLGGGEVYDWHQIAFGAEAVPPRFRKHAFDENGNVSLLRGVWDAENPMRSGARTARKRLHAIMFVAEELYAEGAICEGAKIAWNPHFFSNEENFRRAFEQFPLQPARRPT
jgi:hypothetical protein